MTPLFIYVSIQYRVIYLQNIVRKFIKILRWFFSVLLSLLLLIVILVGIVVSSVAVVLTNSSKIKNVLNEGGIYENLSEVIITIVEDQEEDNPLEEMSMEKEDLRDSIDMVLEPGWVRNETETVIDAVYNWLSGDSDILSFRIDLNDRVPILAKEVSTHLGNRVKDLPDCTQMQEGKIKEEEFKLMDAECRPSFVTDETLEDMEEEMEKEFRNQLNKNDGFENGILKSEEFIKLKEEEVEKIQNLYAHLRKGYLYVLALFTVFSLLLFLVAPKLSYKFLVLGLEWIISSILVVIGTIFLKNNYLSLIQENLKDVEQKNVILDLAQKPIDVLLNDILSQMRLYSFVLLFLGLIFLGIFAFMKLRSKKMGNNLEVSDLEE